MGLLAANVWNLAHEVWHIGLAVLALVLSIVASAHAVLYKRDSRAAIAWVGFIWLVPLAGAALYFILGVNRIRRQAVLLRRGLERYRAHETQPDCPPEELHRHLPGHTGHLNMLARVVGRVVERPLLPGNRIEPLINGDEAFPAMLEAIQQARHSISFSTYIFDRDEIGLAFARALGAATRRGVQVRVLIDATGTRYSWPTILRTLRREGVKYARFLPSFALWHLMAMNLRTHRKILVADGRVGFTGGMNIRVGHCLGRLPQLTCDGEGRARTPLRAAGGCKDSRSKEHFEGSRRAAECAPCPESVWPTYPLQRPPRHPVLDIHFRVRGPVVTQLQEVFADDWLFTTGELLRGEAWFPRLEMAGQVLARGVPDGPDEDFEKLRWTLLGALSIARYSVRIVTPYFLPDPPLVSALNLAAMRGVQVDIVLPARTNLPFVTWASRAMWWQVIEHGCRIWLTPPPFDHSKLMLVDGCWTFLGSANWDPRSLRLNFEYNLECYDLELARRIEEVIVSKLKTAHLVTLKEVDARSLPVRLRDGIARLLTPYL